jgi:septum site-determining protein MinC
VRVERRTLRSGAVLRHGGDVVLYGDVNPGAEILAGGNVTVLGTLLGVAHAGTRTGERAWVLAIELRATQLRIGPHILIPGAPGQTAGRPARAPELALVRDGAIVIEPWRGRLPREDTRRSDA